MRMTIPYGKPQITQSDINAVIEVLQSDYLTQGPAVPAFEEAFASYVQAPYAIAVANGTAALHLSVMALGCKQGDKVITTPITFAASANCVRYCGGEVEFVDIDSHSFLMDLNQLEDKLKTGSYKGIIPVDFTGLSIDMEAVRYLADKHGCWVLEDSCHALGGSFLNSKNETIRCGSGKYADAAIFSFHPVKHIAAGEGGMITTARQDLAEKLAILRTHGITKNSTLFRNTVVEAFGATNHKQETTNPSSFPGWYYEMHELGYNYRLTDFQSALGLSQLQRAIEGLLRRREIAIKYEKALNELTSVIGQSGVVSGHAYHLYVIEVENRFGLYNYLRSENILVQIHYIPAHLMPYYRQFGWKEGDLPNAEQYYQKCISLPMYPTLNKDEQDLIINKIYSFYK